jgi:hypothetical protein
MVHGGLADFLHSQANQRASRSFNLGWRTYGLNRRILRKEVKDDISKVSWTKMRSCRSHALNLFRTAVFRPNHSSPIGLSIAIDTKRQSSHIFQATDAIYSDRMQDIRGVQASLHSYAVPQELDSKQSVMFLFQVRQQKQLPNVPHGVIVLCIY